MLGAYEIAFIFGRVGSTGVLIMGIGFTVMAGSLVFLTWDAMNNRWQPDDYSGSGGQSVPSARAAWAGAKTGERILWPLFGLFFLGGLILMLAHNVVGLVMFALCFPTAILAMLAGRTKGPAG